MKKAIKRRIIVDYKNLDVFVLTYNRAEYLKIMLDSLCTQTATGFKIKVLNNCSTDNTLEVVEEVKKQYPQRDIEVITHEKNLGNPGNFKRSQELAENEYTAIFHDDDAIHPEYIETAMSIFKENPDLVMCSGNLQGKWNVTNSDWDILYKDYYKYQKNDGVYYNLLINRPTFASNIYKTEAYKKVEYHPEKYGKLHDIIFMLEINRLGPIAFILGSCIRWRQSQNNDSNNLTTGPFPDEIANIIKKIKELNPEHNFYGQPLLWNFAFFLYKWSVLSRFLTWYEFEEKLIENKSFTKLEAYLFHKIFYIELFNKLIQKRAEYYRKKVLRKYDSRF